MSKENNGNMYPGVKTWNPLGGECPHKCSYCSTHSLMRYPVIKAKYSGPLKLYNSVLDKCPGEERTVFVVGQNDLFADAVPSEWISKVIKRCWAWDNTYLFQTKNPKRFIEFAYQFPYKSSFCTTIETNRLYSQMGTAPVPSLRAFAMNEFIQEYGKMDGWSFQVTIEPIMDFDLKEMLYLIETCLPDKVNIGADSKGHHLPEPSKEKLLALIEELQKFTTIDRKTNLARLLK